MGQHEQCVLNYVRTHLFSDGYTLTTLSDKCADEIFRLLETAQDNDIDQTKFPDFICDGGWIEHFAVTFGRSSGKGYENTRLEQQALRSYGHPCGPWKVVSVEFPVGSYDNFMKSLHKSWNKHIVSFRKSNVINIQGTGMFLIEIDDEPIVVHWLDEKGRLERGPYSVLLDKQFLDFIYSYRDVVRYVIACYKSHNNCDLVVLDDIPSIKEKFLKNSNVRFDGVWTKVNMIVPKEGEVKKNGNA